MNPYGYGQSYAYGYGHDYAGTRQNLHKIQPRYEIGS